MNLNWKNFTIHLPSFSNFLKENIPKADGIVCDESGLLIIEKESFSEDDIILISNYYDSLTLNGELNKSLIPTATVVKNRILAAMEFGRDLIAEYGASNVLAGLSLEQVQDIMQRTAKVQIALNTGSLYVALAELEMIETDQYIVTIDRITNFRHKIQTYLNKPLT